MIPRLFALAVELATKNGCPQPLNKLPGCWEHKIEYGGAVWWIVINGHKEDRKCSPPDSMEAAVPPFTVMFWRNGWIAGMVDAGGGCTLGGDEDELIKVIESCGVSV